MNNPEGSCCAECSTLTVLQLVGKGHTECVLAMLLQSHSGDWEASQEARLIVMRKGSVELIEALSSKIDFLAVYPAALAECESAEKARLLIHIGYKAGGIHSVELTTPAYERQPYRACREGDLGMIALFADHGFDFNLPDVNSNKTCLWRATEGGQSQILRVLVKDFHVDVNFRGPGGNTALACAAYDASINTVRELGRLGCDINAVNDDNRTALEMAMAFDLTGAVRRFLHSCGARRDIHPKGYSSLTPLLIQRRTLNDATLSPMGDWLSWQYEDASLV